MAHMGVEPLVELSMNKPCWGLVDKVVRLPWQIRPKSRNTPFWKREEKADVGVS